MYSFHWRLDFPLLILLFMLIGFGLIVLYSASSQDIQMINRQIIRIGLGLGVMLLLAHIPPKQYQIWGPYLYVFTLVLLFAVLIIGHMGKGAQRWLDMWIFRFQPSELIKIILPLQVANYFHSHSMPPSYSVLIKTSFLIFLPLYLIAKQPDLGTAILIAGIAIGMLFLAGVSWFLLASMGFTIFSALPLIWHFMHPYQKNRILTFINPDKDPLGTGYHIMQSKIAIGSGGIVGKGWLAGSQSHLQFLPEHATDFIFAVIGEEFGLIGSVLFIFLFLAIVFRGFYISLSAQDSFTRLFASGLSLMFFFSMFVNIAMVTGILPVVGLPLPFVSYGGTSLVTLIASIGILMSIHSHRTLISY